MSPPESYAKLRVLTQGTNVWWWEGDGRIRRVKFEGWQSGWRPTSALDNEEFHVKKKNNTFYRPWTQLPGWWNFLKRTISKDKSQNTFTLVFEGGYLRKKNKSRESVWYWERDTEMADSTLTYQGCDHYYQTSFLPAHGQVLLRVYSREGEFLLLSWKDDRHHQSPPPHLDVQHAQLFGWMRKTIIWTPTMAMTLTN